MIIYFVKLKWISSDTVIENILNILYGYIVITLYTVIENHFNNLKYIFRLLAEQESYRNTILEGIEIWYTYVMNIRIFEHTYSSEYS